MDDFYESPHECIEVAFEVQFVFALSYFLCPFYFFIVVWLRRFKGLLNAFVFVHFNDLTSLILRSLFKVMNSTVEYY